MITILFGKTYSGNREYFHKNYEVESNHVPLESMNFQLDIDFEKVFDVEKSKLSCDISKGHWNLLSLCRSGSANLVDPERYMDIDTQYRFGLYLCDLINEFGFDYVISTTSEYIILAVQTSVARDVLKNTDASILYFEGVGKEPTSVVFDDFGRTGSYMDSRSFGLVSSAYIAIGEKYESMVPTPEPDSNFEIIDLVYVHSNPSCEEYLNSVDARYERLDEEGFIDEDFNYTDFG